MKWEGGDIRIDERFKGCQHGSVEQTHRLKSARGQTDSSAHEVVLTKISMHRLHSPSECEAESASLFEGSGFGFRVQD